MGGKSSQTVGYKYYLGMHMVFSYGNIDEIQDIVVGDRSLKDNGNSGVFPITSSSRVRINSPELFGGDAREGGIEGFMDVAFGESSQQINSYLDSQIDGSVPAYRGVLGLILNKMHLTSMNPYIKPWMAKVKRTLNNHDGSARWYSSKADIAGQCNPAHIIYEVLTNTQWGMGYPTNSIDSSNFQVAADQFHTEGFGLWIKWSSSAKIKDVISQVEKTVDCRLYQDQSTGLFRLKLIRDDYDTGSLIKFNESNIISVNKYEHKGWGETVNEVTVEFTDVAERGKKSTVTVQDLGNIQMQGSIIGTKKQYSAITTSAVAARVAARDLRVLSVPLTVLEIVVNRDAWNLIVGDVFEFSWEKYGVVASYFRIAKIDKGTLSNGQIKISAIEDIFSLPDAVYVKPQNPSWEIPNNPPADVTKARLFYAGFWDIARTLPQANINTLDPNFAGLMANAVVATSDTFNYRIYDTGSGEYTGTGPPSAFAELFVEIDNKEQNIQLMNGVRLSLVNFDNKPYTYILIGTELMRIDSLTYDNTNPTFMQLTVGRGALDTVPVDHAVGEDVWFPTIFAGYESEERTSGEAVTVRLLPRTSYGQLDPSDSSKTFSLTLNDRYQAPYPPGYLQIGSDGYLPDKVNAYSSGTDIVFTVYHRNRVVDTAGIISQDQNVSSSVDNEDEQGNTRHIKYFITIIDTATSAILVNGDTIFDSAIDGEPTEVTYTYSNSGLLAQLTVEIWSQYYGLDNAVYGYTELNSWQTVTHTFLTPGGSMHALGGGPAPNDTGDHNYQSHL